MASDPTTWAELKASLANWLARDDLSQAEIPEAIALAERRFQREIVAPEREATATLVTTAEAIDLPADLWGIRAAFLDTDPRTALEPMTLAALRNVHRAAATGRPQNYAVRGEQLVLGPAPDTGYDLVLTYVQTIPALGDAQPSNWLLADHPDVYLNGALAELHALLRDAEGMALHEARLHAAIDSINRSAARRTHGAAPFRLRAPQVV
jgi:hypothetical protein